MTESHRGGGPRGDGVSARRGRGASKRPFILSARWGNIKKTEKAALLSPLPRCSFYRHVTPLPRRSTALMNPLTLKTTVAKTTATEAHDEEDAVTPFGRCFAQLRQRLRQEHARVAMEIECSEETISHWEAGARLPNADNLSRILSALARNGASTVELLSLRRSWRSESAERSMRGIWRRRSGCSDGLRLSATKESTSDAYFSPYGAPY